MKLTLMLILFVGAVLPVLIVFIDKSIFPEVVDHILKRLPINIDNIKSASLNIIFGTFLEELIYRQLLQLVLAHFIGIPLGIIVASTAFTLMHFSPGPGKVIFCDLFGIFVDSILFGVIFSRSNILFSWIAHCLSDFVALVCLMTYKSNHSK